MSMNGNVWLSGEGTIRTYSYLKAVLSRHRTMTVQVQSLFGRCCLVHLPELQPQLDEVVQETAALADGILQHPASDQLDLDPLLLIESYRRIKAAGRFVPAVEQLLQRMAMELNKQSSAVRSTGRVRNITSQLASLGYPVQTTAPSREASALLRSPERWLRSSAAQLTDIADHLIAMGQPLEEETSTMLALLGLAELRNYHVDQGCKLLRVACLVGAPCPELTEGLSFIALQRRRDGRYGFSNPCAGHDHSAAEEEVALHLPLTVNAVWLLQTELKECHRFAAATRA